MKILDIQVDNVINGVVAMGYADYEYTFNNLVPLINKTEFQRKLQDKKFYRKLQRDIDDGCVMPPITIAFITREVTSESDDDFVEQFVNANIEKSFVLDGIQRLNTLSRLINSEKIDKNRKIYINFIFSNSVEKLLYRMITLNNGQRPMTPRHQVEIIMANTFNFEDMGICILSEKDAAKKTIRKSFRKSDIIQAYLAFMAETPIIDNKKIIEEKMDELLVSKIMSIEPTEYETKFEDFINALIIFQDNPDCLKWLKMTNNLIGFAVGMKKSAELILALSSNDFKEAIDKFDSAFSEFNPSRIKVGKFRRELSCEYFTNFDEYKDLDADELLGVFSEITND